jgi:hypothetical protein
VRKQLEREGAADVVGDVGDAQVKVGQVGLHDVAVDDLKLLSVRRALHAPLQLQYLSGAGVGAGRAQHGTVGVVRQW